MIMKTTLSGNYLIVLMATVAFNANANTLSIPEQETDSPWLWTSQTGSESSVRPVPYIAKKPRKRQKPLEATTKKSFVADHVRVIKTADDSITYNSNNDAQKPHSFPIPYLPINSKELLSDTDWRFPWEVLKRKSEIKCEEYGQAVAREVWILPLVGSRPEAILTSKKKDICGAMYSPLIVGGSKSQPGEFPHMVALGWTSNGETDFLCGGTLISELWVLTAAHCTHGPSGGPTVVRIGAHRLSDNKSGEVIGIDRIQRHPAYRPPAMYADIALLKLKRAVTFGTLIRPACLHAEYDKAPTRAWVTGWGVTQFGDERSDDLLKTRLDVVDNVICALRHNRSVAVPRGVVPSMVCAGDPDGGWNRDTCQGDSGGPLQVVHPTYRCLYQLVGITSFGKLCALRDSPGVYTRVSHYLDWIEPIVWPDEDR